MPSIALVRQFSEGYDKLNELDVCDDIDVIDICGMEDAQNYLFDLNYDIQINDQYAANRAVKFLPNQRYDLKVYLDYSIKITDFKKFTELIHSSLKEDFILKTCRHPHRSTIAEELLACYQRGKITKDLYKRFSKTPAILNNVQQLTQNGFMISRYSGKFRDWSEELVKFLISHELKRDQITLALFQKNNNLDGVKMISWPNFFYINQHNMSKKDKLLKKLIYMWRKVG